MGTVTTWLTGSVAWQLIARLPGTFLRWFYPASRLRPQLEVRLGTGHGTGVPAGTAVPRLDLWFEFTNLSDFPVTLQALSLECWASQPFAVLSHTAPITVPARSNYVRLRVWTPLSGEQIRYLGTETQEGKLRVLRLVVQSAWQSKIGPFDRLDHPELRDVPCSVPTPVVSM